MASVGWPASIGACMSNGCAGVEACNVDIEDSMVRLDSGIDNRSSEALVHMNLETRRDDGNTAHHFDAKVRPRSEQSLTALRRATTPSASTPADSAMS